MAAYAEAGTITEAAQIADIDRTSHYRWLRDDPTYAERFKDAHEQSVERLEQEARRRAAQGWDEPVYHKGKVVGHVRKFSDTLLIFLLKGAAPEKYKDRVQNDVKLDTGDLTPEQAESLIRGFVHE